VLAVEDVLGVMVEVDVVPEEPDCCWHMPPDCPPAVPVAARPPPRDWALAVETNAAIANAAIPNRCIVIILNSRCQLEVW
jgi:hypothetical protein